jgi:3,4-dihydroxy 2-butanone 4-phosphate synthase/GTP cyclohydrolase II
MGELEVPGPLMVRLHTECLAGDAFGGLSCSCRAELQDSVDQLVERGRGVLLYIRSPGGDRGRLRHLEPVLGPGLGDADQRAVDTAVNGIALSMLTDLGVTAERLRN